MYLLGIIGPIGRRFLLYSVPFRAVFCLVSCATTTYRLYQGDALPQEQVAPPSLPLEKRVPR
jgi:hypothetical protein